MKATVDSNLCNGCGPCEEVCPEVFEVVDNLAMVRVTPVPVSAEASCRQAASNCPTNAISLEE